MSMNKFTKGELKVIAETDHVQCGDAAAMARIILDGMYIEPTPNEMLCDFYEVDNWPELVRELVKQANEGRRTAVLTGSGTAVLVNDVTTGKRITITLPDISSKAFWSGAGKTEVFHPETYKRWVKEAIERHCAIARIDVEVK
ncbi:hypothetical protein ACRZER_005016 [Raoultella ornithinolytica]|nr:MULTISPECIES: hypothetical protein [Klebsiella]MEE1969159.1 hypothetical protein [Klebsiella michiganensis]VTM71717.1 Uncharacterised protein [Raoultella planticola]